jgi:murein DD-endopeptidase MepM/ murein hydrolase activator NlpD
VRPGRILAARFQNQEGDYTAVYFETPDGRGGYYRPDGSSVEGQFLMAPLRHARITSSYSSARRHPILKITRPHRGIDYAASIGTPVMSVADGVVVQRSWTGGNGNLVQIRHANGYVSSYAHLSRYADGLRVGDRVEQKQVIGFVGQTGLATGPHVCFRIQKNGKYVDPSGCACRPARRSPGRRCRSSAPRAMRGSPSSAASAGWRTASRKGSVPFFAPFSVLRHLCEHSLMCEFPAQRAPRSAS